MTNYDSAHPWEQWFCRFFDENWTPSRSPYFYKLQFDKDGKPKHLQRFYKEKDGGTSYCGTYEILYHTQRMNDQYVIIKRVGNQSFEHISYIGDERAPDEIGDSFVARYYPTGWNRIEMMPPSQASGEAVIEEYRNIMKSEAEISMDLKAERDEKNERKTAGHRRAGHIDAPALSVPDGTDRRGYVKDLYKKGLISKKQMKEMLKSK